MDENAPKIREVNFQKRAADKVRRKFLRLACNQATIDDDMAGFVIVSWNKRGRSTSCLYTLDGPISEDMLSIYVSNEINRRIAAVSGADQAMEMLGYKPDDSA